MTKVTVITVTVY